MVKKATAVVVFLSLLTACARAVPTPTQTPEPTPTPYVVLATEPEHVAGVWGTRNGWYIRYLPDGTTRYGRALALLDTTPESEGRFWFEGTVFHEESADCAPIAAYEIRLDIQGRRVVRLLFNRIEDPWPECFRRSQRYAHPLDRVNGEE